MPTYEYLCSGCGHRFDRFQPISAAPLSVCPECGGAVERLISGGGGFLFKGSGFHATDYQAAPPSCGRETPCCGADAPCLRKGGRNG